MKKVRFFVLLGLLILVLSSVGISPFEQETNTIIFVDDDNTQGPWYGSSEYPYQHIQDGIDNASSGDTVFVNKGDYVSTDIFITKPLILQGESVYQTNITYAGYASRCSVIHIQSSQVEVRGFRITNRNKFGDGIQLIDCNDCVIHGNVFNTTYENNQACGLYLENADNNICYNEFTNFWKSVALTDSMMNHIEHNNFNTTSFGSHFFHAYHLQYLPKFIIGNKFKNNYYPERFFVKTVFEILNYSFDLPSEFFRIIEGPKTFAVPIVKLLILEDPVPDHSISFPFLIPVLKFEWTPSIQPHTIRG